MEDVEGKAEQQPFSGDLRIAAKQKTPEIKILLHIRKVAFGLNGTIHPKQTPLKQTVLIDSVDGLRPGSVCRLKAAGLNTHKIRK